VSIAAELVAHRNLPADERIGRTLQREAAESS
jgi:hypothetical protein